MTYLELTEDQKVFLKAYAPVDDFFTNHKEIKKVSEVLNLQDLEREQYSACRNSVVKFYSELESNTADNYMTSMMSVTAVIDSYIYGF